MQTCRTSLSAQMLAQCAGWGAQRLVPHSCGHRSCPHCQHFESQRWIERQTQALLPGTYFLITFTLPAELRALAWSHQQTVFGLLMQCAWDTLAQFSRNHHQLKGQAGCIALMSPIRFSHTELAPHQLAPMLGAHNRIRSRLRAIYFFSLASLGADGRGLLLCELARYILMQDACDQSLVRHAFSKCLSLDIE